MITGIHHIAIIPSTEKSVEFYERLGFKKIFRKSREYDIIVLLEGYGMQLELFIDPNHPERSKELERIGLRHLALKVNSCEEMSRKFKCGSLKKDWMGVSFCCTEDPDELPIEFHE